MKTHQQLTAAIASGTLSLLALNFQTPLAQAATLSQTYTVNLNSVPLNSNTQVVLPKFNSLLGTLLQSYVTISGTVSSRIGITPTAGNFTGTAITDSQIAVNIPTFKADPFLTLSLFVKPPETTIAGGTTGTVSGTASGTASKTDSDPQLLSFLSGCAGDSFAFNLGTTGNIALTGTPAGGTFLGSTFADLKISVTNVYASPDQVPEPTTIAGGTLAMALGCWWKRKTAKK